MPNMLAHLGVQMLATKAVSPRCDLKWVALGCLIPDIAWIGQRIVLELPLPVSPYDVRLYAVVQSSLLFCLLLAGALALLSNRAKLVFAILAGNVTVHLLMDATQTKWANGVHLLAPYSWDLINFGWYWPESTFSLCLTVFGLVVGLIALAHDLRSPHALVLPRARQVTASTILLSLYLMLPLVFIEGPAAQDNHSVSTLRAVEERAGASVEFDRVRLSVSADKRPIITTLSGERLRTEGVDHVTPGLVSIKGVFVNPTTVHVDELHAHYSGFRDYASYLGLRVIGLLWIAPYVIHRVRA